MYGLKTVPFIDQNAIALHEKARRFAGLSDCSLR
jgi:hypothetical protein